MAKLAGAIYQDTIPTINELKHVLVANGTAADVAWLVTDSIGYDSDFDVAPSDEKGDPLLIRTITIRGFDASDENVDRERLVQRICNARSVPLSSNVKNIVVHEGLLEVARDLYRDIKPFIDMAGPTHKIVLNGHSIGGALSNLILMMITAEHGVVFTQEKIKRIFTFGSPPIAATNCSELESPDECSVLQTLGLQSDMVYGYIKPWVSFFCD
jgi:Lipase (class 3).